MVSRLVPTSMRVRSLRREFDRWSEQDDASLHFYRALIPPNGLVFDVGANVGRRVRVFRKVPARVVAIEPQPRCAAVLQALFGNDRGVTIEPTALGAAPGMAQLLVADVDTISTMDPGFADATKRSGRFAAHTWSERVQVPVITLDSLIARHGAPDFIKIDVEGFELEVLKGLSAAVRSLSVEFVPELWTRTVACVRHLAALGPIEANLALGEKLAFESSTWMDVASLERRLETLAERTDLFGDVYVRRLSPLQP